MANLKDLLAMAKAEEVDQKVKDSKVASKSFEKPAIAKTTAESRVTENQFDQLDEIIDDLAINSAPSNFNDGFSKDGNQLEVGDPVVGIHKAQRMSGTVVGVEGDNITVEWKDKTVTQAKADTLELTDVDDDYEEESMYIESAEMTMGFDKESFNEDSDLEDLLRGSSGSEPSMKYNLGDL